MNIRTKAFFTLLVAVLLWSSSFAAIRLILQAGSFTPGHIALGRFIIASLVLAIFAAIIRIPLPKLRDIPALLLLGLLGISIYHTAQNYGQATVTAGSAGIIIGSVPVFMAISAVIYLKEHLRGWGWLGIVIGFGGISLISLGEKEGVSFNIGVFYLLIAAISTAVFFILEKPFFKKYSVVQIMSYTTWAGTLGLLIFSPGLFREITNAPIQTNFSLIYLGLLPSVLAYFCWNYGLSKAPASVVASFLYLQPIFTIVIAWFWLKEIPPVISILGGGITIIAVILVDKLGTKEKP